MKNELVVSDSNIGKIARAISSPTRWSILRLLRDKTGKIDVSRIADALKQTEANISAQIKILEKAGLVIAKYEPGEHGVRKICDLGAMVLIIQLGGNGSANHSK